MKTILAATSACLFLGVASTQAQIVTLRSFEGNFSMTGELTDFDGENYTLESPVGSLLLSVSMVACEGEECPDLLADISEFAISGSNTIGSQMMPDLIEAYAYSLDGDIEIEVLSGTEVKYTILDSAGEMYSTITLALGNSDAAFSALENGDAYIALSSRSVRDSERNRFLQNGLGDLTSPAQERILARDGMSVSVNPQNPIKILSLDQISGIFSGNISNWREVGGLDEPINVYRREASSGATQAFEALAMAPTGQVLSNTAFIREDNAAVSDAVFDDRSGIGITSLVDERNAQTLALRSVCGQVSDPSNFSIKTEEYPMTRRLFMYLNEQALPDKVQEFVEFATSDAAQAIVERSGFVSQTVATASLNDQGRRLAHALMNERDPASLALLQEMVTGLLDAERMSLTFRFEDDTTAPDIRALADIARLAEMVKNGDFDGRRLLLIGFADNAGDIDGSQQLSQDRAESVRSLLEEAVGPDTSGIVEMAALGYGKLSPIACNETDSGRAANRRVEVWLR